MDEAPDPPFCCAAVARGKVTLNRWSPRLVRDGPCATALAQLADGGVVLFDLYRHGDEREELTAARVRGSDPAAAHEEVLAAWARDVGYRRLWLPSRVICFDGVAATVAAAAVTCPTCGLHWRDESARFWARVRADGHFPACCLACNGSLPEWCVDGPEVDEQMPAQSAECGPAVLR